MTDRAGLQTLLRNYTTPYKEEAAFVSRFLQLLEHPSCYQRDHLPGHMTGSAWIVNQEATKAVMVQHGTLRRWLQPGGHADGDENIVRVALREAEEETGVVPIKVVEGVFDVDIHRIPAKPAFPEHEHYDVRVLMLADDKLELKISNESTDLRWIPFDRLDDFTSERAVLRLREKAISSLRAEGQRR